MIAEKVRLLSASTGVTEARILTAVLSDDSGGGGGGGAATLADLQEVCWESGGDMIHVHESIEGLNIL